MCAVSYMDLGDFDIMHLRGTTKHANLDDLVGSDPSDLYFVYGTQQDSGTVAQFALYSVAQFSSPGRGHRKACES